MAGALLLAAGASPALADDCITSGSQTFCDPASFHVSGNLATGSDPVVLGQGTEFTITKIDGGAAINKPLTVFFAVPVVGGVGVAPTVTSDGFDGAAQTAFGGVVNFVGQWNTALAGAAKDLYSFVGCPKCDNSLNIANLTGEESLLGNTVSAFNVFSISLQQAFALKNDFETFDGLFGNGTFIAPLAADIDGNKTTFYDTSFTNTGFVDAAAVVGTPEPSTWFMGVMGFGFIAAMGWKRKRTARYALAN
jgi:hypothetical protein